MADFQRESLAQFERWDGPFPGEHEFSALADLQKTGGNPELDVFLDAAQRLVDGWQGNQFAGVYLYGPPGTGKTHAAIGLGRELHDAGAEIHYRYVPELSDTGASSWNSTRADDAMTYAGSSIFPSRYSGKATRNPKSVLILDDYRPDKQAVVTDAVDAAAQFGGLVIVTSNYIDPFKLLENPGASPDTVTDALNLSVLKQVEPDAARALQARRTRAAAEISASLRSRLAAGFKFIEFTGPDRRIEKSFWND